VWKIYVYGTLKDALITLSLVFKQTQYCSIVQVEISEMNLLYATCVMGKLFEALKSHTQQKSASIGATREIHMKLLNFLM